jgi:hypothetical protein
MFLCRVLRAGLIVRAGDQSEYVEWVVIKAPAEQAVSVEEGNRSRAREDEYKQRSAARQPPCLFRALSVLTRLRRGGLNAAANTPVGCGCGACD